MTSICFALFSFYVPKRKPNKKYELLRRVAPFTSSTRRICDISCSTEENGVKSDQVVYVQLELDYHDDTISLVHDSTIMGYNGCECEVSPYMDTYVSIKKVPIVTGENGYTSPITGQRSILIFNEALCIVNQIQHTIINPNQLSHFGLIVKDDPYATDELMRIEVEDVEFVMSLQSDGTVIYLDTWKPTYDDLR